MSVKANLSPLQGLGCLAVCGSNLYTIIDTSEIWVRPLSEMTGDSTCHASFTYTVCGNSVTVTNTSTGNFTTSSWYFGDCTGWILATSNPFTHVYNQPGSYNITLGLDNGSGLPYGCDSIGQNVTIGDTTTEVKEINNNEINIVVYPNPATNNLTIEILQKSTIDILNIQGQIILQEQIQQGKTDIDISGLAKGIYFLRMYCNDRTAVTKIVKE